MVLVSVWGIFGVVYGFYRKISTNSNGFEGLEPSLASITGILDLIAFIPFIGSILVINLWFVSIPIMIFVVPMVLVEFFVYLDYILIYVPDIFLKYYIPYLAVASRYDQPGLYCN